MDFGIDLLGFGGVYISSPVSVPVFNLRPCVVLKGGKRKVRQHKELTGAILARLGETVPKERFGTVTKRPPGFRMR